MFNQSQKRHLFHSRDGIFPPQLKEDGWAGGKVFLAHEKKSVLGQFGAKLMGELKQNDCII